MKRRQGAVALALVHCGRMSTDLVVLCLSSQCSFKQDLWAFTYLQYEQSRFKFEVHPEARQLISSVSCYSGDIFA
jgi:hypothetical protein